MKVTISGIGKPDSANVNDALQWFCKSIGLFSKRDKDNSCFRVFIELFKETKKGKALSSDEIASRLGLVRGTVVPHLNRMIDSGVAKVEDKRYSLRAKNLRELTSGLKEETCKVLDNIGKVAAEIDKSL